MKKLGFLLLTLSILACTSNDEGIAINQENLIGKWYFAGEKVNSEPYFEYQNLCGTARDYMELTADGGIIFEYKADCTESNLNEPAEWSFNGMAFTFTDYDPAASFEGFFKIIQVTQNKLTLQQRIEYLDGEVQIVTTYFTKI